jgi:Protein of unknown function (DUF1242)
MLVLSALFNFQSLLVVILLFICTSVYLHERLPPSFMDDHRTGIRGMLFKAARVGERLSPYVAGACILMAFAVMFSS